MQADKHFLLETVEAIELQKSSNYRGFHTSLSGNFQGAYYIRYEYQTLNLKSLYNANVAVKMGETK